MDFPIMSFRGRLSLLFGKTGRLNQQRWNRGAAATLHFATYAFLRFKLYSSGADSDTLYSRFVPDGICTFLQVVHKPLSIPSTLPGIRAAGLVWTVWYKVMLVQLAPPGTCALLSYKSNSVQCYAVPVEKMWLNAKTCFVALWCSSSCCLCNTNQNVFHAIALALQDSIVSY